MNTNNSIEEVRKAYICIRQNNQSIPDEILDLMKDAAIEKLSYQSQQPEIKPFGYVFEGRFYQTIDGMTFSEQSKPIPVYQQPTVEPKENIEKLTEEMQAEVKKYFGEWEVNGPNTEMVLLWVTGYRTGYEKAKEAALQQQPEIKNNLIK